MSSYTYEKWCRIYGRIEEEYIMPFAGWYLLFYVSLLILNPLKVVQ